MLNRRKIMTAIGIVALSPVRAVAKWFGNSEDDNALPIAQIPMVEPRWDRFLPYVPVRFTVDQGAACNHFLSRCVGKFNSTLLECQRPWFDGVATLLPDTHLCVDYRVQLDDRKNEFFGALRFQPEPRGPWVCFQDRDGLLCQKRIYESIDIAGELARVGLIP